MRAARAVVELSDETLMDLYARGDGLAFDELFARYQQRAYAFFLRRTRSEDRAAELYQELFLRLHCAREGYDPGRPFAPWFFQIASRLLVDDHRRAFRNHEVPLGDRDPGSARPDSEEVVGDREHFERLLLGLSPEERYAVWSARVLGIDYAELAQHLDKSVDAVKKMVSRAIQRAREHEPVDAIA